MTKKYTLCASLCALLFATAFVSCNKFGGQEVPSYIHIDSITVNCDYAVYGASTSKITDAWVYVDDQIVGCFELPATFPIIAKGPHKISIRGGICEDGRGSARGPYPFYQWAIYKDLNLVEDSIINLNPQLVYYPINEGVNIGWMEDFETTNSLIAMPQSDTSVAAVSYLDDPFVWYHNPNSYRSGRIDLPPDSLDFYAASADEMSFHKNYVDFCLLEMDYNCNDTFFVGVTYLEDYAINVHPLVKVLPTDKQNDRPSVWKKMYVNLGPFMNEHTAADYFKVYFTSNLSVAASLGQSPYYPLNEPRHYYLDNLKVLYRPR